MALHRRKGKFRLIHESTLDYLTCDLNLNRGRLENTRLILAAIVSEYKGTAKPIDAVRKRSRHRLSAIKCQEILDAAPLGEGRQYLVPDKLLFYCIDSATRTDMIVILELVRHYMPYQGRGRLKQNELAQAMGLHYNSIYKTMTRLVKNGMIKYLSTSSWNHPSAVIKYGKAWTYVW